MRLGAEGPPDPVARCVSVRRRRAAVVLLLAVHAGLLAWSAARHSPNANEPAHLAAGISHWEFGRFDLYQVNPPLVRMVASAAALVAGCETEWSRFSSSPGVRSEFPVGEDFVAANGERSLWLTTLARWACLPFSVVGGAICFLWSRDLYGHAAGLVSLALWCFCPNILGHASCITADAHATAVGLAANYAFWRWLKSPTWGWTAGAGFALGLALLSKTTWILLLVLWPLVWSVWRLWGRGESTAGPMPQACTSRSGVLRIVLVALLGLHVLNMGYLYDGSFRRLKDFEFVSRALRGETDDEEGNRFRGMLLGSLRIPLPAHYVMGIDVEAGL